MNIFICNPPAKCIYESIHTVFAFWADFFVTPMDKSSQRAESRMLDSFLCLKDHRRRFQV